MKKTDPRLLWAIAASGLVMALWLVLMSGIVWSTLTQDERAAVGDVLASRTALVAVGWLIGLVLVAPIEWRGRAAARITTGWVAPGHCASGVGRALVRGVAGGLLKARATVVLARADVALGCAALPAGFLAATGFAAQAAAPLWALDLTTAVRAAKPSVLDRLGRLVQSVGPLAPPEPAHNGVVPPR